MDWKQLLAYITGTVDQELLLRNEYLVTENRILRHQITGRVRLTDGERKTLALAQLARSQRDAEQRCDTFGVLAEGFVEISEPEQHDGIGVLTLDPLILLEDRGRLQRRRLS